MKNRLKVYSSNGFSVRLLKLIKMESRLKQLAMEIEFVMANKHIFKNSSLLRAIATK